MIIDIMPYLEQCAPNVAPSTMQAIIKTESKGNPLSIGINKGFKLKYQAKSENQAKTWVKYLEDHGYNFDVGLAQVNIKNIHKYGYYAIDALDPCINLKIASAILKKNYIAARNISGTDQDALKKAISAYNTGNYSRGFNNGYVQKVYANASKTSAIKSVPPIVNTSPEQISLVAMDTDAQPSQFNPNKSKSVLYVRPRNAPTTFY